MPTDPTALDKTVSTLVLDMPSSQEEEVTGQRRLASPSVGVVSAATRAPLPLEETSSLPDDINAIIAKARKNWLSTTQMQRLLEHCGGAPATELPETMPTRPKSGTLFYLLDAACRNSGGDEYDWEKRSSRLARERRHDYFPSIDSDALYHDISNIDSLPPSLLLASLNQMARTRQATLIVRSTAKMLSIPDTSRSTTAEEIFLAARRGLWRTRNECSCTTFGNPPAKENAGANAVHRLIFRMEMMLNSYTSRQWRTASSKRASFAFECSRGGWLLVFHVHHLLEVLQCLTPIPA
jgi:hypothetical protein